LQERKEELEAAGIPVNTIFEKGPAGDLIVTMAKTLGCDLIIMGNRGLGPIKSILLGSTSTYVLHHSPCPVLVIPVEE
jgi:nucleotide-binding universal stress UspA family protein